MTLTERQAFLVLNALPGQGPVGLNRLLGEHGGDPRRVLSARFRGWSREFDLEAEERRIARSGGDFLARTDPRYPPLLREIHDPPLGLYRRGRAAVPASSIAVVGARGATPYGIELAARISGDLARRGICVVSGLARGIDTAAHEGALACGGPTVGVLGHGIDRVYPPENRALFERVAAAGALLSEFPFGTRASRRSFPMRNRIVSGTCSGVLVVESAVDGGAMITARMAGEQGRAVFAVPGRIDQPMSAGCHALIRDGAVLVRDAEDLLFELSHLPCVREAVAACGARDR